MEQKGETIGNLKPCPFCSGNNLRVKQMRKPLPDFENNDPGDCAIICCDCRCIFMFQHTKTDAINLWNGGNCNG